MSSSSQQRQFEPYLESAGCRGLPKRCKAKFAGPRLRRQWTCTIRSIALFHVEFWRVNDKCDFDREVSAVMIPCPPLVQRAAFGIQVPGLPWPELITLASPSTASLWDLGTTCAYSPSVILGSLCRSCAPTVVMLAPLSIKAVATP